MQIINRKDLPLDHGYYRTCSPVYKEYLCKCGLQIHEIGGEKFGWIKSIFGLFQVSKFERLDEEPNIEKLKKAGFQHGLIIWIPYSKIDIPAGWKKLWLNSHFTTTGFTKIEDEKYYQKWKQRAKRARKKFLDDEETKIILVDRENFIKNYKESKISQPFKSEFIKYYTTLSALDGKGNIKSMICFHKDRVVAGLAVIEYNGNSSAHLVSFLTNEGKNLQAGTGLIDYWFAISLQNNIKYINFDHLRDKFMPRDQQGYTDFKENFMENKVVFNDSYFKII